MSPALLTPCLLALALPGGCPAPCADPEARVDVTVVVILATDKNDKVDPKLKCIAKAVQEKGEKLTGFRLGPTTCKSVKVGDQDKFPLVEGQELLVEARQCPEDPRRLCLKVTVPKDGGVTYTCVCGKYFPFLTGHETKDKDRVIVAVMVERCKD